jgi:hypothetical protein
VTARGTRVQTTLKFAPPWYRAAERELSLVAGHVKHQKRGRCSLEVCGKEIKIDGKLIRIAFLDGEGYQFLDAPEAALESLRSSRARIDLFTFIPRLSDTSIKFSYPMEWDNMAALRVSTFDEWMTNTIDFKVRNKVRKSAKNGVEVREVPFDDALVQGIHTVYNESPTRQGKPFRHYGKDLDTVRRMSATFLDRSTFIGAFLEGDLIGFVKLVSDENGSQAGLMHIVSMMQHRDKAPTNALVAQAVRSCAERGISYLWYANMSYGKKQGDTLADFKRHNGFEKIQLPRYYVPLTFAGGMALRVGLHHNMSEWVPESLAARYRRIRKYWHERRFFGPENA